MLKKLAGPPVYYGGMNEHSLAPQFKWLEYTFKHAGFGLEVMV
jgi:hypothetical protein